MEAVSFMALELDMGLPVVMPEQATSMPMITATNVSLIMKNPFNGPTSRSHRY